MVTRSSTRALPAPPHVSWAFVVDHGHEIEPLGFEPQGQQGVGTLNHVAFTVLGKRLVAISRTTIWDPPFRCAFESVTPTRPVRVLVNEEFHANDLGGTRHEITYEVTANHRIANPIASIVAAAMIRNRRQYQDRLCAALTGSTSA